MKVNTTTFAGNTIRTVMGHPEHDLLFVASDIIKMAGLSKAMVSQTATNHGNGKCLKLCDCETNGLQIVNLNELKTRGKWQEQWLFNEALTYLMLLRGNSDKSEAFRKWVADEVLPSIRKTGSYDVHSSSSDEGRMFAAEFAAMRKQIAALTNEVAELKTVISDLALSKSSPYEGQVKTTVHDMFSVKTLREISDSLGFNRLVTDKIQAKVVIQLEELCKTEWDSTDGRKLESTTSIRGKTWCVFPKDALQTMLSRSKYREAILAVVNNMI